MSNRDAVDTIKGYFYQFDYSIKSILTLQGSNDQILIEGIEDVDINTLEENSAVQCKYYEGTEYNHSVIKKAIQKMLTHYSKVKDDESKKFNYKLYGHFKSGTKKLPKVFDIDFLKKNFLTYTKGKTKHYHHKELNLSDRDLKDFLTLLSIDTDAEKYDSQLKSIFSLLKEEFECSTSDAENFYYNNSLRVVKDLSVEKDKKSRRITRGDFVRKIYTQKSHFNAWFAKFKGKKKYHKYLRQEYFSTFNTNPYERFFLIEIKDHDSRGEIKDLIFTISEKYSQLSKRKTETFCPYIHLFNYDEQKLINLKTELQSEGFNFIDGYDFYGASFSPKSLKKEATPHNKLKIKFVNTLSHIDLVLKDLTKTKKIFQFIYDGTFYQTDNEAIKQVDIVIDDINDISNII